MDERARRLAQEVVVELSKRYSVPEPRVVFQPIEREAEFQAPSTIAILPEVELIVNAAQADEWDRFLRTIVSHEFMHYIQYRKFGPLEKIPPEEYAKMEREAEDLGLKYSGMTWEDFQTMLMVYHTITKYIYKVPIEEAIEKGRSEWMKEEARMEDILRRAGYGV